MEAHGTNWDKGSYCSPLALYNVWDDVEEILLNNPRGWRDTVTLDGIKNAIESNIYDLWLCHNKNGKLELVVLCSITRHDVKSTYNIAWVGGKNLQHYITKTLPEIEKHALMLGADKLRVNGRDGWARILKKYGYQQETTMTKDISILWN